MEYIRLESTLKQISGDLYMTVEPEDANELSHKVVSLMARALHHQLSEVAGDNSLSTRFPRTISPPSLSSAAAAAAAVTSVPNPGNIATPSVALLRAPALPSTGRRCELWPVDEKVGRLDLERAMKESCVESPETLYKVSRMGAVVPYLAAVREQARVSEHDIYSLTTVIESATAFTATAFREAPAEIAIAFQRWGEAERSLGSHVTELAAVFEDVVFPHNKFARKRADLKGPIYLPGLIKAMSTNFSYKKIFSSKTAGGRRQYAVAILVDVSASMAGHIEECTVESLVLLLCALQQAGIESVSIICFGSVLTLVKTEQQPWDASTAYALLSSLRFGAGDSGLGTKDADAIFVALDLLESHSTIRGPKKVFVLTDGFSTCGLRLSEALVRAYDSSIEVVGICVGLDRSFVANVYQHWITAAIPSALVDALRQLYTDGGSDTVDDAPAFGSLQVRGAEGNAEDLLSDMDRVFKDLAPSLKTARDVSLIQGSRLSRVSIDIAFVLDVTGSMEPWLDAVKEQTNVIVDLVTKRLTEEYQSLRVLLRFAIQPFRDIDDREQFPKSLNFSPYLQLPSTATKVETAAADEAFRRHTVSSVKEYLSTLVADGGGDTAEDVLGALQCATECLGWESKIKFLVLIGDAPAHGALCNPNDPTDRFPGVHPKKLTVESVMRSMNDKMIRLFVCHIKKTATMAMFNEFVKAHKAVGPEKMEPKSLKLFSDSVAENRNAFHWVFCLDESGSMTKFWDGVVEAYNRFLSKRRSGNQGNPLDRVSVVTFDSSARAQLTYKPIEEAAIKLAFKGGGTDFNNALRCVKGLLDSNPSDLPPCIMLMSDGDGVDGSDAMREIRKSYGARGLQVYTIPFGGAKMSYLNSLAEIGGGKCTPASDVSQLGQIFTRIATEAGAADGLVSAFGKEIGDMIADRLVLDYL
jgi:Mg-chelatase subunit ChlD